MKSIKEKTVYELIIKKSTFITTLIPCDDESKIQEIITDYRLKYNDANHNCLAYIVGNLEKADDDGEPSKTAGMPMLNVLQKQGLTNIIAIVTRYFGGIKLGAGGLTRAYTQSIAEALKHANIIEKEPIDVFDITVGYNFTKKFEHLAKMSNVTITNTMYLDDVCYTCYVKDHQFFSLVQELTANQYGKKFITTTFVEIQN